MTRQEACDATINAGCGWSGDGRVVLSDSAQAILGHCNLMWCDSVAAAATKAGKTPAELGAAALAFANGDAGPLNEILSA